MADKKKKEIIKTMMKITIQNSENKKKSLCFM